MFIKPPKAVDVKRQLTPIGAQLAHRSSELIHLLPDVEIGNSGTI
jgi:hypothetical protein